MSQMAVFFLLFSFSQSSAWNFNIFSNWRLNSQKAKIICKKNIYTYVRYFKIAWSLCTGTVHFFPLESVFSSLQDVDWEVDPGWHSYYYSIQLDITALLAFLWLLFSIIFFFSEACWEQYKRNRVPIETISMKWKWNFIFLVYLIPKGGWQILACCCLGGRWRAPLVPSYAVIDTLFSQTFWWGIFSLLKIWWFLS